MSDLMLIGVALICVSLVLRRLLPDSWCLQRDTRSEDGQANRQIGGAKTPAKPVRIAGYKELRIPPH
jgi:hypothetical protein